VPRSQRYRVEPGQCLGGEIEVPGDKSISHRSLILGAIADGETLVHGFLESEGCVATRRALEQMGVTITRCDAAALNVDGVGIAGLVRPASALDLGNSGTGMRLLAGLLAGQDFDAVLTGDASLRRRPMERIAGPLRRMGARVETTDGHAPLTIHGGSLEAIDYTLPMASAQVKSALLLAGLQADGRTILRSPGPSRDHTERMLLSMGAPVEIDAAAGLVAITGPARLRGRSIEVPGDISSAAFFIVAGLLAAESPLTIKGVGVNPTRAGILTILERMGGQIELVGRREAGTEPVADIRVRRSRLRGIRVPPELGPLAIDEFPVLFVAAAAAEGTTSVTGASELRHKESDRIGLAAASLRALGVTVVERPDGLDVIGGDLGGGAVDSQGDHRIAMAFAVAGVASRGPIEILNTREVATSFPGFVEVAAAAGLDIGVDEGEGA
jgi:3-phosphoshikimate 1-carboxyvinyltransferase